MGDEKLLRNVVEALGNDLCNGAQEPPPFGGKPGELVPEVDPDDVKTVWQIGMDAQANHASKNVAVGIDLIKHACRPEANIEAVTYRASSLWLMSQIVPEQFAKFTRDGQPDVVAFHAAAKVPLEWMGVGVVREGPPFDVNEFLRLCGEGTDTV